MGHLRVGVAVLTMRDRPAEPDALPASVAAQNPPADRVVVVGNGSRLPALPDGVTRVEPPGVSRGARTGPGRSV